MDLYLYILKNIYLLLFVFELYENGIFAFSVLHFKKIHLLLYIVVDLLFLGYSIPWSDYSTIHLSVFLVIDFVMLQ